MNKEINNKAKKFLKNERMLEVLGIIAKLGFIMFLGVAAPNAAGHIIKMLGWVPDYKNKYRTKKSLVSLYDKKFINHWTKNGKSYLEITKKGNEYLARLKAKSIKLPRNKKWDGLWRIVTFDIPEKLKINRKRFSETLNSVGMCNLEKSIFVYPHECKDQILEIAELYEVGKYIRYIMASSIEPNNKLRTDFPFIKLL